jgi:phage protein D
MASPAATHDRRPYVARPTLRLNGSENARLASLVVGMDMVEESGGLSGLELRLTNVASLRNGSAESSFDAGGGLEPGMEIIVGAGDSTAPTEIFRGAISAIEGVFAHDRAPELVLLAEDALQKARMARRSKTYEQASLGDIAREIARRHGLTPRVTGLDQRFGVQVQLNESDLAFLRRLLRRVDADLQVVAGELHVSPRSDVRRGEIPLALGAGLRSVRVTADLADQVTRTTVEGWDVHAGNRLHSEGQERASGPGAGQKGAEILRNRLGSRTHHVGHLVAHDAAEAQALAGAVRDLRARRFVRAFGVTEGHASLRVGTHVKLSGLGRWFSNTYYVVKARHLFDLNNGYATEFEAECAWMGRPN